MADGVAATESPALAWGGAESLGSELAAIRETALLIPPADSQDPELSIVIPALDEQLTISEFVSWCREGLARAGAVGEIVIVDSSADETAALALEAGARVLRVPRRGLGRAYKDAIPHIRGRYVLMGDADCTYDFRDLEPFVDRLREGCEFVMGSRWKGSIESGAMPRLHRYLGTPVTTWILNRLYSSRFSDIHCGMRAITREGFVAMNLESDSWEYASEMVLKSVQMGLRTAEVPVHFLKDRNGRLSHHRRSGWSSPWRAAWANLRAMFIYGSDFFLLKPGLTASSMGLLFTLSLIAGPVTVDGVTLSLYWMLLGMTLTVVGFQAFMLGCIAQVLSDYSGRARSRWLSLFSYTRSMIVAALTTATGIACGVPLIVYYLSHGDSLSLKASLQDGLGVTGLMLIAIGFSLSTSTLVLHAAAIATRPGRVGA
ncbi:MAG: glycosyltransferase family 2 protein [Solirubrobacteraceae bacterium]